MEVPKALNCVGFCVVEFVVVVSFIDLLLSLFVCSSRNMEILNKSSLVAHF